MLRKMFLAGAKNLEVKKNWINELNVFPVPDGDTGTNMTLTIMSAANEVNALNAPSMDELCKAIASGSLRGARGNSGVILSQLLRGFTKVIRDYDEVDAALLAEAAKKAVETAYKAVMKPKEGTILTVARALAEKAVEIAPNASDLSVFFTEVLAAGSEALANTPELLPVLKEAGVVDSGGTGLMAVIEGGIDAFNGKEIDLTFEAPEKVVIQPVRKEISTDDIKFGYCTEFIVMLEKEFTDEDEDEFKKFLTSIGDSIVCVAMDDIVKVHVHTNHPGQAFEKGLTYGQLTKMKVDNMREEHKETLFTRAEKEKAEQEDSRETPRKKFGFISVTIGDGMTEIFKGLGVDYLIEGGQTMNPSTDDMLKAIEAVHAENVFILPNNKNVILAASQAKELVEDCNVLVVPTKTVPQGITAVVNFIDTRSPEENLEVMTEEIQNVKTGEVTYAVRDTKIDGVDIHSGDIMGIGDSGILAVGSDVRAVTMEMLEKLVDDDSELISVYAGQDFTKEEAEALGEEIEDAFPDVDIESNYGGQPIYYCIVSVE
ncbi:MAG: DAK2 domain-containing protein [Lachnospiraceae bacterium]|nr:DAK2 domain-containing protein [Lachnospiraceae bacterium]